MPIMLVAAVAIGVVVYLRFVKKSCNYDAFIKRVVPAALRIAFVAYPIVSLVAFEAFSCYTFEDGSGWLVADVAIACQSERHRTAKTLAWVAIAFYPVGLLALNAALLFMARHAIRLQKPSKASAALAFLHREYALEFYWWELMEMGRRFLLVGLFVIWPFHQGSVMQVAVANLTAATYLFIQLQAMPYRNPLDNYVALAASFSLQLMLLCIIFYKYASLTELPDVQDRMSLEQRGDYQIYAVLLTTLFILSVFGAVLFSALLLTVQVARNRRRRMAEERESLARRL